MQFKAKSGPSKWSNLRDTEYSTPLLGIQDNSRKTIDIVFKNLSESPSFCRICSNNGNFNRTQEKASNQILLKSKNTRIVEPITYGHGPEFDMKYDILHRAFTPSEEKFADHFKDLHKLKLLTNFHVSLTSLLGEDYKSCVKRLIHNSSWR